MSFFDNYDVTLISNVYEPLEYKKKFLQKWKEFSLCISIHPILDSPMVIPPLLNLEDELKKAKCAIDEFHKFDPRKEEYYNKVTRILDPFSFYRKQAKKNVFPELSMTNAWLKCWEMLHVFQVIPFLGHVKLFCNAELPGAFLYALNHYVHTRTKASYEWVANSLYPSDGSILGDQFGLVQRYPDRWLMSKDHNGSVTNPDMIQRMEDRCQRTIDLYTSDIGIGLEHDTFLKQEELEAPLHLGQIICGLRTLKEGGHLICKTFMFFYPFSMSLLYLTSQCFDNFYIYKPETSRAANSEVYLVGKGFKLKQDVIDILMNTLTTWSSDKMNEYIVPLPEDVYLTIFLALHRIYKRQIEYIHKNINTVSQLYKHNVQPDFRNVRNTNMWKNEQKRLVQWRNNYDIPYLSDKFSL